MGCVAQYLIWINRHNKPVRRQDLQEMQSYSKNALAAKKTSVLEWAKYFSTL